MKSDRPSRRPCGRPARSTQCASQSTANTRSAATGPKLTSVLRRAWTKPFSTKSDFARALADHVALAASDGLITTRVAAGMYGREWLITAAGINRLRTLLAE